MVRAARFGAEVFEARAGRDGQARPQPEELLGEYGAVEGRKRIVEIFRVTGPQEAEVAPVAGRAVALAARRVPLKYPPAHHQRGGAEAADGVVVP